MEQAFAKLRALLRKQAARTIRALGDLLTRFASRTLDMFDLTGIRASPAITNPFQGWTPG